MKLRTKIMIICSAVLIVSIVAADFVLLSVARRMTVDEGLNDGYIETLKCFNEFESFINQTGITDSDRLSYYLKTQEDDYTVLFQTSKNGQCAEIFNNTVFSYDELINGDFENIEPDGGIMRYDFSYKEKQISAYLTYLNDFVLFHIVDMTDMYRRLNILTASVIGVSVFILLISSSVLYFTVKRSMLPLSELVNSAKDISAGDYSKRIAVRLDDEVGLLSEEFNKMAQSVETRENMLKAENERRRLFMGNLTHELKTPLTAISGYAQTMRRVRLSDDDYDEALEYIHSECKRIERLSRKMMNLLEFENGVEPQIEAVSITSVFGAVKKTCEISAEKRNVSIETKETDIIINTDCDLMTDVLINLCDNGIKASKEDSAVTLSAEQNDGVTVITVTDSGCGIPKEEFDKIFEPFYTLDRSRCRKNGGCGLGLALSSLIIKKLGMKLEIDSVVGNGTEIKIYIYN